MQDYKMKKIINPESVIHSIKNSPLDEDVWIKINYLSNKKHK